MIVWTETVDVYAPGGGDPLVAGAVAYVEPETPSGRVALMNVSRAQTARLWMDVSVKDSVSDGTRIFRTDSNGVGSWWTVRGTPLVYEGGEGSHIEALISSEVQDGFFGALARARGLSVTLDDADIITGVLLEISTSQTFDSALLTAASEDDQTNWHYAVANLWADVPNGGVPTASSVTFGYFTTVLEFQQGYYVRWTPLADGSPLTDRSVLQMI